MPSLLSRIQHDAASLPSLTLPIVLLVTSTLTIISTSPKHALLGSAIAWLLVLFLTSLRVGIRSILDGAPAQKLAWGAGLLSSLAQVCERAVDGRGIWWAKALPPLVLLLFAKAGIFEHSTNITDSPTSKPSKTAHDRPTYEHCSKTSLLIATISGLAAVYARSGSISVIAIGLSYAVLEAFAFNLLDRASKAARVHIHNGGSVLDSANGLLTQPMKPAGSLEGQWVALLRDVSAAGSISMSIAAFSLESFRFGGVVYYGLMGQSMGDYWVFGHGILSAVYALGTVLAHVVMFSALVVMIHQHGALLTSFVPLAAVVSSQLLVGFSLARLWLAVLCSGASFSFFNEPKTSRNGNRMAIRIGRLMPVIGAVSFLVLTVYYMQQPFRDTTLGPAAHTTLGSLDISPPTAPFRPLQYSNARIHPIKHLVQNAQVAWKSKLKSQSQSLEDAIAEYRRRYDILPPPHFDKWYEFAKKKEVELIDEYDTIYHSLLPFWGLSPATIRARARESLGFGDNNLMGLLIRDGKTMHVEGGQEWLQQAAVGMMEQFIEYLPDMDLAFNVHDEPRVVVPHDELSRLIQKALNENLPAAASQSTPRNAFSGRPKDVKSGKRIEEVKTTRFNVFAHQPTWIPSRLSCSPESPARALEESLALDNLTAYALGELGFVYNHTAFSDVCNSPSLSQSHGFFDRPNAFNVVHDLFPIFSQSKMSSFQDIVYPSPWYWYGKVKYDATKEYDWVKKESKLWWRGSTTGGFSRAGGWRRQHRQKFVAKVNSLEHAKILQLSNAAATDEEPGSRWVVKDVPRQDFKDMMDVHFSHIGQCDPGDCDAQREFFKVKEPVNQQDAWQYKYLLDIDGNAFSGRFYAFLMSHSLTFKLALFREWHEEWIKPWIHYIPLSLRGDEALEAVRYFDSEEEGRSLAVGIAEEGHDWALKTLRNEDFEVWLFRLLLEYGRVIDDNRTSIGYTGA